MIQKSLFDRRDYPPYTRSIGFPVGAVDFFHQMPMYGPHKKRLACANIRVGKVSFEDRTGANRTGTGNYSR